MMGQIVEKPSLGFSEAINKAASNVLNFNGRARRSEFWWTILVEYLAGIVLTPIASFVLGILTIPLAFRRLHDTGRSGWWLGVNIILKTGVFFVLIYDIIMLATRPTHYNEPVDDMMWAFFIKYGLICVFFLIYQIILIIFYCQDSAPYANEYGESPKYVVKEDEFKEGRVD